jgi:multidrug efflux pump subunit AcrB
VEISRSVSQLPLVREAPQQKVTFVTDKEKAALNGVTTQQIADTLLQPVLKGSTIGLVRSDTERNPLRIELRVPRARRTSSSDLVHVEVKGDTGQLVSLAELGRWDTARVDQTIYHKNLQRVAYVFAETAGRPPADVVVDVQVDKMNNIPPADANKVRRIGNGSLSDAPARPVAGRTFFSNGGGIAWGLPAGFKVDFAGEGEWKITLDVFRDLGLAFGAAMIAIYILLVAQTGSFAIPVVVMLAIPLTILGVMPGFWLLNAINARQVGGYLDPVYFTATGMIGMIALAGIVTRGLDHSRRFHPPIAGPRTVAIRRHYGKPRGPSAPDPADGHGGNARRGADHRRSGLFRSGLVADLRAVRLDALHAVCNSHRLLAPIRP